MQRKHPDHPTDADRNTESGRISRSGTDAGISVDSESTSGGEGPIEPGEHVQPSDSDKRPRKQN